MSKPWGVLCSFMHPFQYYEPGTTRHAGNTTMNPDPYSRGGKEMGNQIILLL